MISLKSPSNYNELLEQLNKITFFSSFIFFVFMSIYGYTPIIKINPDLLPAADSDNSILKWAVSFGLVPITLASVAFLASFSLEAHNLFAKIFGIRLLWDWSITKRALKISQVERPLNRPIIKIFMRKIYYKEIEKINDHYIKLFWRYTLSFWAMFEHFLVVSFTIIYLSILHPNRLDKPIFMYLLGLLALIFFHWLLVASRKSHSQVEQIDKSILINFFKDYR